MSREILYPNTKPKAHGCFEFLGPNISVKGTEKLRSWFLRTKEERNGNTSQN